MKKELICKHFKKESPCGFTRWLEEKPYSDTTIPENGCGKNNIDSCYRLLDPEALKEYCPRDMEEHNIALPAKYPNSKGRKKRLP